MDAVPNLLDIGSEQLEYRRTGNPDAEGPVLVFLHEGLGCVAMWKDFPDRIADATGKRAFIFSRSCYGASSVARYPREVDFMHREGLEILPKVLDAAGIDAAILVGHSDGGSISLINAGGVKDPRVKALILEAAHVFVEDLSVQGIEEAKASYQQGKLKSGLARYHGDNVEKAFWGWNDIWLSPGFLSWNIEEYLPGVTIPTLVIQGEDDAYGTLKQVEAIVSQVSGPVEKVVLKNCGHSPHNEKPAETCDAMAKFINALSG
jgi:pimeloyl-ACP methyl ester carboxylesterase